MRTKVILSKSGTSTANTFYYINVYTLDSIGFTMNQYSSMISESQYFSMKGNKEETYQHINGITVCEIGN